MSPDQVAEIKTFIEDTQLRRNILEPESENFSLRFISLGSLVDRAINELAFIVEFGEFVDYGVAVQRAMELYSELNNIKSSIETGIGNIEWRSNPDSNENSYRRTIENALNGFYEIKIHFQYAELSKILNVLQQRTDGIGEIEKDSQVHLKSIKEASKEAEKVLGGIRSKSLVALSNFLESKSHSTNMILAVSSFILGVILIILGSIEGHSAAGKFSSYVEKAIAVKIEPNLLLSSFYFSNVLIIAVIAAILFRIAFASWHNVLIANHRKNLANSIEQIKNAFGTPNAKDVAAFQVVNAMVVHQSTGFSKSPLEGGLLPFPFKELSSITEPQD